MAETDHKSVLSELKVREAMRRLVIHLFKEATITQAIRQMIRFKLNAVLIVGGMNEPVGVVSRTDIVGAFYAGLPIDTLLGDIMHGPVLFCEMDDSLDSAITTMRENRIHRLYVSQGEPQHIQGVLAYSDVLGLLYRYCHKCPRSTMRLANGEAGARLADHFKVCELMTPSVNEHTGSAPLMIVMESLFSQRLSTALIKGKMGTPVGVVSTTDLMIAYLHGLSIDTDARAIMSAPVRVCDQDEPLVNVIQKMIFADVQNLYVYKGHPRNIVGVLSLSEIARIRSGSCRACLASRIELDNI